MPPLPRASSAARVYPTADGWAFLMCPFEDEWTRLCDAIERPDLLRDPRFADAARRAANDDALSSALSAAFAQKPASEWERILTAVDVGCVQAEDRGMYHFFSEDPHVQRNGLTVEVSHPRFGDFWRYAPILSFSEMASEAGPGITLGQHTIPILKELGYDDRRIREMRAGGALDWEEVGG